MALYLVELQIQPTQWYNNRRTNHLVQLLGRLPKSRTQKLLQICPTRYCYALCGPLFLPPTSHSLIHTPVCKNKFNATTKLGIDRTTFGETIIHVRPPRSKLCICSKTVQLPFYICRIK